MGCGLTAACAPAPPRVESPTSGALTAEKTAPAFDAQAWGTYHSKRFGLVVPLPGMASWAIDDSSRSTLQARHAATQSTLVAATSIEPMLMNRQRCEARARSLGWVPDDGAHLATLEDDVTVGPAAFDTRIWVAIGPGASDGDPITGHVFAFGAYVRKCLFFHFATEVPSARDESTLSTRLALVRTRVLGALEIDDFDEPPKAKP